jgi:hypothetical protein
MIMQDLHWLRDPTAETQPLKRPRVTPPASLDGLTIGLFDIGKTRTPEFLDRLELQLNARGLATRRYGKPTNAKVATPELVQRVVAEVDAVVIGLSD